MLQSRLMVVFISSFATHVNYLVCFGSCVVASSTESKIMTFKDVTSGTLKIILFLSTKSPQSVP